MRPFLLLLMAVICTGCAMVSAWKNIPPPGGCDQCHTATINNDWKVSYQAPVLTDERNRLSFQTQEYNMPRTDRPASALELRKGDDLNCFECHRSPNSAHRGRAGKFHH